MMKKPTVLGELFCHAAPVAALAAVFSGLLVPYQSYMANADEFIFTPIDFWLEYGLRAFVIFSVVTVILTICGRWTKMFHFLIIAGIICAIIEIGPLSIGLPELNGQFDGYYVRSRLIFDSGVLIFVFGLLVFFYKRVCAHLLIVSGVLLLYLVAMAFDVRKAQSCSDSGLYATPQHTCGAVVECARYSSISNTLVLIVDSVSNDVLDDVFVRHPELKDRFRGFVEYKNNVGMHWMTSVAVPALMSGQYFSSGRELDRYAQLPWTKESFACPYIDAKIPVFVNLGIGPKGYTNRPRQFLGETVSRPSEVKMAGAFAWTVDNVSWFRLLPYALKGCYGLKIARDTVLDGAGESATCNILDDRVIWRKLGNMRIEPTWSDCLQVHHSLGGHPPVSFDEDGHAVSANWAPTYQDYLGQCTYVIKLLADLMDNLREKGIYNGANIVILGDHGVPITRPGKDLHGIPQKAFPCLMVKSRGDTGMFAESDTPTSLSKVANLVRRFLGNELTRADVDSILRTENRLCREIGMGVITDYEVSAKGEVKMKSVSDAEPEECSLEPMERDVTYSFNIADQDRHPEFSMKNGSRASHVGVDFFSTPTYLAVRAPDASIAYDVELLLYFWGAQHEFKASANGCCETTLPDGAAWDNKIVLRSVKPDGRGVVRVVMTHASRDPIISVKTIKISAAGR